MEENSNHYQVLGIEADASADEIRSAWRKLVSLNHPDRCDDGARDDAEARTQAINEAWTVLRDGGRRAAYDCTMAAEASAAHEPAPPNTSSAPRSSAPPPTRMHVERPWHVALVEDVMAAVRRYPKIVGAAAAVWVLVFGGSLIAHLVAGPTLPAVAAASTEGSSAASTLVVSDTALDAELEQLLEQNQRELEAEQRRAVAAQRLADEQAAKRAAQLAAEQRAYEAAVAKAARQAARKSPKEKSSGSNVIRILPSR